MAGDELNQAINLIKAGKIRLGRRLLTDLLLDEPTNELAWLWLHVCVGSTERKIYCLQKALKINPDRVETQQSLEHLMMDNQQDRIESSFPLSVTEDHNIDDVTPVLQAAGGEPIQSNKVNREVVEQSSDFNEEIKPFKSTFKRIATQKKKLPSKQVGQKLDAKTKPEKPPEREDVDQKAPQPRKEIIIPFRDPQVIIVNPNENMFADRNTSSLPILEDITGLFGRTLLVDGVRITSHDMPECLKRGFIEGGSNCNLCDFFSASHCPIRTDPYLLDEARYFFLASIEWRRQYEDRRQSLIRAIYRELKEHGRPLHYTILAKIISHRYPHLDVTQNRVLRIMSHHPEAFVFVEEGVYTYRRKKGM